MPFSTPHADGLDDPFAPDAPRSTFASGRRAGLIEALKVGRTHRDIADALGAACARAAIEQGAMAAIAPAMPRGAPNSESKPNWADATD